MTVPVIRQRAKRPKTRTGCRTCKSRRVKCDEDRPACRKCSSTGRECGGYEVTITNGSGNEHSKRPILPGAPADLMASLVIGKPTSEPSSSFTAKEWYAVDFFQGQTTFQLPGVSMTNSWETLALRLSYSEPAIRSAVIALGSLHRARGLVPPDRYTPPLETDQYNFALQHYARAVSSVQKRINAASPEQKSSSVEVILLACLMFMSFELLQGSYALALQHRGIGVKILGEYVDGILSDKEARHMIRLSSRPRTAIEILSQAFICIDYDLSMSGLLIPALHATVEDERSAKRDAFETADEARLHLNVLTNAVYRTRAEIEGLAKNEIEAMHIMHLKLQDRNHLHCWLQARCQKLTLDDALEVRAKVSDVEQKIADWSSAFACMSTPCGEVASAMRMMLQIQFMVPWVLTSRWRGAPETKYDRFYPVFCQTIASIEQLMAHRPEPERPDLTDTNQGDGSLWRVIGRGTGIVLALHLIATKCRDSVVRWKALALMGQLRLQEGMVSSNLMSPCSREIVILEESRARLMTGILEEQPLTCRDVPEEARIIEVTINADPSDQGYAGLVFTTPTTEWPGFVMDEHWFSLAQNGSPTGSLEVKMQ